MYETIEHLKIERRGKTLWVVLDNPPFNGFNAGMHREMSYVFREISRDPETRCVVLTGAGERGFSAGGDIAQLAAGITDHTAWNSAMPEAREIVTSILECDKPIIARINGHAMGLGASIALACDITIMVDSAKIADTHVRIGLAAGDGGALLWPHLVGWMRAKRYLLSGDILIGKEAEDIGLVTFSVPRDELDAKTEEWAEKLANGATRAIAYTKRSLNMAIRHEAQLFLDAQLGLETMTHLSPDHAEAVHAFLEKREPNFSGV